MSNYNTNAESAMRRAFNAVNGNVHELVLAYARNDISNGGCAYAHCYGMTHFEAAARQHEERVDHFTAKILHTKAFLTALGIQYITARDFSPNTPPEDEVSEDEYYSNNLSNDGHFTVVVDDTVCSYDALTDIAYVGDKRCYGTKRNVGDERYVATTECDDHVLIEFAVRVLELDGCGVDQVLADVKQAIKRMVAV